MKAVFLTAVFLALANFAHAFVVPLSFDQKCYDADAVLEIEVEKVERLTLTEGMPSQFKSLARCKVLASFKGEEDWAGKYIFIPCDYEFDESPCDIEQGKSYVVFLETMGIASKFGHPLGASCCHEIVDGKVHPGIAGTGPVDLKVFAEKVFTVTLKADTSNLEELNREKDSAKKPATEGESK